MHVSADWRCFCQSCYFAGSNLCAHQETRFGVKIEPSSLASYNQEPAVAGFLSCCSLCGKQDPPKTAKAVCYLQTEKQEEQRAAMSHEAEHPCLTRLLSGSHGTSLRKSACTSHVLGRVTSLPPPLRTPGDSSPETDLLPPL